MLTDYEMAELERQILCLKVGIAKPGDDSLSMLTELCAKVTKLTSQRYERIIAERVADDLRRREAAFLEALEDRKVSERKKVLAVCERAYDELSRELFK